MEEYRRVTRLEKYLAKIIGEDVEIPASPIYREEFYLAKIAGETVDLPAPITNIDKYLAKIAGETVDLPAPISRIDKYLAKIAGEDVEAPEYPLSEAEKYLAAWAEQGGQRSNVLINWYLPDPVNQRQVSTFNIGKYGADMWKCNGSTVTLTAAGFSIPDRTQVLQYIMNEKLEVGETYTLTLKLAADVSHVEEGWSREGSIQFKIFSSPYASTNYQKITLDEGKIFTKTFTIPESQGVYYGINIDGGNGYLNEPIVVEAVKLEKGEFSTLANDTPPNKQKELRLCQEWFQMFPADTPLTTDKNDYDPVMYSDPTIGTYTISGVTYATASCEI